MLADMTIQRMDNVAIVVDDVDAAVAFFTELGMELEGRGRSRAFGRTAPSAWTASGARSR
jgi:catechol 2,3-dioxygenase-like lactoylglutathione lyase family enzyme